MSVKLTCDKWSELPEFLEKYSTAIKQGDGVARIFGYASLISSHANEKASSQLPNEEAKLYGHLVAMNVLAVGEKEYRGTWSEVKDTNNPYASTKSKNFIRNTGCYAGLEQSDNPDNFAHGINITLDAENAKAGILSYVKRELGDAPKVMVGTPPQKLSYLDLFDENKKHLFKELENHPENNFGLYKIQMFENKIVDKATGKENSAVAITVATNEKSPYAAIHRTDTEEALQAAVVKTVQRICDGQGIRRAVGNSFAGGDSLAYFENVVHKPLKDGGYSAPMLDRIAPEIDKYLEFNAKLLETLKEVYPTRRFTTNKDRFLASADEGKISTTAQRIEALSKEYGYDKVLDGEGLLSSPYYGPKANMVHRDDKITGQDFENAKLPRTAMEKIKRLADLHYERHPEAKPQEQSMSK
jgi:hypothetical protein